MTATVEKPQHFQALEVARQANVARGLLRRQVKAGETDFANLVADPPACVGYLMVGEFLLWPKGCGRKRAVRIMGLADVSETRRLGELTSRERRSLSEQVRLAGMGRT